MGILGKATTEKSDVDKVNHRISSGRDPFALAFGTQRYMGFAVKPLRGSSRFQRKDGA